MRTEIRTISEASPREVASHETTLRETTPREATPREATPRELSNIPELYVSTAPAAVLPSLPQRAVTRVVASSSRPVRQVEEPALTRREVRQERRAQRKAVRTQLKQWLKAAPQQAGIQETDAPAKQQVDGFTRIGIIVGAAGLVMLLVGLLAGGNAFLVALGGILLGIGVVFWLIDAL